MFKKIKKAVIPAAGLGTRFLPVTKAVPKEMIPIIDKPMIHYIVEEAIESGIEDIILITAKNKESIEHYFDYNHELEDRLMKSGKADLAASIRKIVESCNVISVYQKEPMGLGHAVGCAQSVVGNQAFAVLLGDDLIDSVVPCTKQLWKVAAEHEASVIGVMEVPEHDTGKYGMVEGVPVDAKTLKVSRLIEKPKPGETKSRLAIPGRYVLDSEIFTCIRDTAPGAGGEIQLTDALMKLAVKKGLYAHQFEGDRYDTGDRMGYLDATLKYGLKRPELREGLNRLMKKHLGVLSLVCALFSTTTTIASVLSPRYQIQKMVELRSQIKRVEISGTVTPVTSSSEAAQSFQDIRQIDFAAGTYRIILQDSTGATQVLDQKWSQASDFTKMWLGLGVDPDPLRVNEVLTNLGVLPAEKEVASIVRLGKQLFWEWGDTNHIRIKKDSFWFSSYSNAQNDEVRVEAHSSEGGDFRLPRRVVFKRAGTDLFEYELTRFRTNSFSSLKYKINGAVTSAQDWIQVVR